MKDLIDFMLISSNLFCISKTYVYIQNFTVPSPRLVIIYFNMCFRISNIIDMREQTKKFLKGLK